MFAAGTPDVTCAPGRLVKFVPVSVGAPYMAESVMLDAITVAPRFPAEIAVTGIAGP
jgi:hypothetical protein